MNRIMTEGVFSLTLTLSRWEREQPLSAFGNSDDDRTEASRSFAKRLETIPPLPKGEGRGEGEQGHGIGCQA